MAATLEKALQDAQVGLKVLQVLTENSYDSILVTDATKDAKIIYANKAFKTLTGYDPSEVIGKTPRILQGPATDRQVIARLADALKNEGRFEGKAINYRKDGAPFIMHWRVLPAKIGSRTKVWVAVQREGFEI
ncbi:MAG: PAS domain-containing protein [Sulfuritalea sp.]|nr:PAS domain-containing protein [Sulfuritalea sp.]